MPAKKRLPAPSGPYKIRPDGLNIDFWAGLIEVLHLSVKELGYPNLIQVTLPNGIQATLLNQYAHAFRLEIKDIYRRDIAPLIFDLPNKTEEVSNHDKGNEGEAEEKAG